MKQRTTIYSLTNGKETLVFSSEKDACKHLGVATCSVASCFRRNSKCKGYSVNKMGSTTHGESKTRLFKIWTTMHERCERVGHDHYKHYGGRGIKVCEEWKEYVPFASWARGSGYREDLSIDRIDVNGNYEPGNCRWVTEKEQQNNKRSNRVVVYNGKAYTLTQLAETVGLKKTTLKERLNAGWSVEEAVTRPVRLRTRGYRPSGARMESE